MALAYQTTLAGHDVRYLKTDTEFARCALGNASELADLLKGCHLRAGALALAPSMS